ncbi:hypothetical protein HZH66_002727 [Vespula vulgaris]|uniref:Uncharacterized protein n=1 Tax=Vespula vulgaris TaxID=7454 RepID=A0A834KK99_VESVU|nr:hypothetical protein HZH66_002727 [Vespula vulgaris]
MLTQRSIIKELESIQLALAWVKDEGWGRRSYPHPSRRGEELYSVECGASKEGEEEEEKEEDENYSASSRDRAGTS